MFFNLSKYLSYNALLNFIIGFRSAGKTYAFKDWALRSFLKSGAQFVYLRRYEVEIESVKQTLFDDIAEKFNVEIRCEKNLFYLTRDTDVEDPKDKHWEVCGYAIALSGFAKYKSAAFDKVDKICYDEFLIENKNSHYLKNEMQALASIYHTIARRRRVRLVAMANSSDIVNPFFDNYHIRYSEFIKSNTIFRNNKTVLFVYYKDSKTQNELAHTEQALAFGESFTDYAFNGNFMDSDNSNVVPKFGTYQFNLTDGHFIISIYRQNGRLWIGKKAKGGFTYTSNPSDLEHVLNPNVLDFITKRVQLASVFFEDVTAKLRFITIMRL